MKLSYFTNALHGTANCYMNSFCNLKCYSSQFTAKSYLFKNKNVLFERCWKIQTIFEWNNVWFKHFILLHFSEVHSWCIFWNHIKLLNWKSFWFNGYGCKNLLQNIVHLNTAVEMPWPCGLLNDFYNQFIERNWFWKMCFDLITASKFCKKCSNQWPVL
jgi:hypothetical protein